MKIDQSGFLGHQKINNGASFCPNVGCPNMSKLLDFSWFNVFKTSFTHKETVLMI